MAEVNTGTTGQGPGNGAGAPAPAAAPAGSPGAGAQGGQPTGGAPAQGGAAQGGQPSSFAWQSDERFREDKTGEQVWKSYQEAQKQLGEMGQYKQLASQVQQYGGLQNLVNWAMRAYQQQQQPQAPQNASAAQQAAWYESFADLTPQEQAQVLHQQALATVVPYIQQIATQYAQANQEWQTQQQRAFDIYRKVVALKMKNPELDENDLLQRAASIAGGGADDLLNMALSGIQGPTSAKAEATAMFERWKADEEQKRRNQQVGAVPGANRQNFQLPKPLGANATEEKNSILQALLGQGTIAPGQV